MWENIVQLATDDRITLRMHIACWIPKATNTHSEYVILLFHRNNDCIKVSQCYVIRTLPASLSRYFETIISTFL